MDLVSIYNEYISVRSNYLELVNKLVNEDMTGNNEEEVLIKLKCALSEFEVLKENCDKVKAHGDNLKDLQDLKYLLFDALLLSSDLAYFYESKSNERFKMRAVNFINKLKREQVFGTDSAGTCRV